MPTQRPVNFDDFLDDGKEMQPPQTIPITLYGTEWHLLAEVNQFTVLNAEAGQLTIWLVNSFVEDERRAITAAFNNDRRMSDKDGAYLIKLCRKIQETVAGFPTTQPSGSSPGGSSRTSKRGSVARASSARGAR